jgi:hypothetical protein
MSRKKLALGLDPRGGHRFSDKDMRHSRNLERIPIPHHRDALLRPRSDIVVGPAQSRFPADQLESNPATVESS